MLYRALKMWFWVTYDHLGRLLLLNFLCALPIVGLLGLGFTFPGPLGLAFFFVALFVATPAALAALGHFARTLIDQKEAPLRVFFAGARLFGPGGALLGAFCGAVVCISAVGVYYYLAVIATPTPFYAYPLAAVCTWVGTLAAAVLLFALPALSQRRAGVLAALRTGLLLAADNPIYCAAIALHLAALAACALAPPVLLVFSVAPIAVLQATAYEMLARKYAAPLVDGKRQLTFNDADDDYLNRGLRDFFFPWKM